MKTSLLSIIIIALLNAYSNNKDTLLILSGSNRRYWDRTDGLEGYVFYKDSTVKEYDQKRHIYFTRHKNMRLKMIQ